MVTISETEVTEVTLASKLELLREDELPEKTVLKALAKAQGPVHIQELAASMGARPLKVAQGS